MYILYPIVQLGESIATFFLTNNCVFEALDLPSVGSGDVFNDGL